MSTLVSDNACFLLMLLLLMLLLLRVCESMNVNVGRVGSSPTLLLLLLLLFCCVLCDVGFPGKENPS
ncbi:hypothetical protein BDB00DRAFT_832916 [Zychaea mexicana]|uniref:uncharacterized protein n=1 Tax=Zychaea mexicana TaxID=64656 RepID=UPI0022FEED56|nr:uncharacterized protein BDB00DRAFT_832916 [Zychaea mexicana]KAI9491424.1 hypothetical protein BDB00DRAFT_832916 [Zychaea mexicana]